MSSIRSKVAGGLCGAGLLALSFHLGCGSDEAGFCSGCGGGDASAGTSGTSGATGGASGGSGGASGGSGGSSGASGDGGSGGASGGSGGASGDGGTAGAGSGGSSDSGGGDGSSGTGGQDASAGSGGNAGGGGDASTDATGDASTCGSCSTYGQPSSAGNVGHPALRELSGMVASRRQPGVFFAHNDSGDSARFFAIDQGGRALGEFQLQGATATDWEDLALGPCPAGSCLFIADIGDNTQTRASVAVVRVTEPDVAAGSDAGATVVAHERFEYRYAPGPQNAEALLADPKTGHLYIVTKDPSGSSLVFRIDAPQSPGAVQTLQTLTTLTVPSPGSPLVTGGAAHPCASRLLLRTYSALFEYTAPDGAPLEAAFTTSARPVPAAIESQGEAVTYLADGLGYVTASEGNAPALYLARCQ